MITEERKMTIEKQEPLTWDEMRTLLRHEPTGEKTWKPVTGGLLQIVAGYFNILMGVLAIVGSTMFGTVFSPGLGVGLGVLLIGLGVISAIGGIYTIQRRMWGMALIGSITATIVPSLVSLLGILSIIFVSLGKPEFGKK